MVEIIAIRGVPHSYELTPPTANQTANQTDVLVFIHGWLLSRSYWEPIIQHLSADYRCLSYDLRGFGDSQLAAEQETAYLSYNPAAYAEDLIILLHTLQISSAWLIGHSLGGTIALWAADQLPQQIKGVICINSGGGIYLKEEFERFRAAGQQLVKLRPRWLCHLPLVDLMMTRLNVARPLPRIWGRKRLMDLVTANPEAAIGALLESTTEEEVNCLPQVIARLKQPVHFIAGAEDTIMEPQYVRHLASFHSSFQSSGDNVNEIPDCGHLSMVEQPQAVTDLIRKILTSSCCH
jgi:2-succinyl-6-hydroxy-2,4-cyclohexadiene-1-carboxylate synthase